MNALRRGAVARLVARARSMGLAIPAEVEVLIHDGSGNGGALAWAAAHPDDESVPCCWGSVHNGAAGCGCWVPVYDVEQAAPVPGPVVVRPGGMCVDCAYRPRSPERAEEWQAEELMDLAASRRRFFCHQGMRRPTIWVHPDGRRVPGDLSDYQPPMWEGVPFRADGQPGWLCAGWAALAGNGRHDD